MLAFAGAFRRSELVSLDVADVEQVPEGLRILVRRSKTDREAAGKRKPLPYGSNPATCPVRSLAAWLRAAEISEGPIFRPVNRHDQIQSGRLTVEQVESEHRDLLVLTVRAGQLRVLAVEHDRVGRVPVLDHLRWRRATRYPRWRRSALRSAWASISVRFLS